MMVHAWRGPGCGNRLVPTGLSRPARGLSLIAALGPSPLLPSCAPHPEGANESRPSCARPQLPKDRQQRAVSSSAETMGALLRALHARSVDHPESPALIASWPGVPEAGMHVACAELSRQGHAVRELSIAGPATHPAAAGRWTTRRAGPPRRAEMPWCSGTSQSKAAARARAVVKQFAESKGASETVRSSAALAVSEACSNAVLHAYVDAESPGDVEVRADVSGDVLVVEVSDDGRGMVPASTARASGSACRSSPHDGRLRHR